ncbi:MAG: hypothetical protein ACERKV_01235 [Clostridiaceae bacterium]
MKNKKDIIIVALLGILLIMVFNQGNKINNINDNYTNLSNQIYQMQNDILNTNSNINSLVESKKLIQNYDYKITKLDDEYKKAKLNVDLTFNSIAKGSKVYYVYRKVIYGDKVHNMDGYKDEDITYGQWVKVELEKLEAENFIGELQLDYAYNYETKVIVETNEEIISEDLYQLDLYEQSKPDYDINVNPDSYSSDGTFIYSIDLNLQDINNDVKVKSAYCEVYYNDKIVNKFEIMNDKNLLEYESDFIWYHIDGKEKFESDEGDSDPNIKIVIKIKDDLGREYIDEWDNIF